MNYIDNHPRQGAFVANKMQRLLELINDQGKDLLKDAGLTMPPRAVSSIQLIGERGQISTADIAKELTQPHQLVTQRIEALIRLGLIERLDDPDDGRRKILALTPLGQRELKILDTRLIEAALAFEDLYNEINHDLSEITMRAMKALSTKPLLDRIKANQKKA